MSENSCESVSTNASQHEVISEFEKIRQKQRHLHSGLIEAEIRLKEFREVSKILHHSNPSRKCYRLMLDQLVESNIENILPSFLREKDDLESHIEELHYEISYYAKKLTEFQRTYDIRLNKSFMDGNLKMPKGLF